MATATIGQLTLAASVVAADLVEVEIAATGLSRKVEIGTLIGATLTGNGIIATGGFTGTLPATGTLALKTGTPVANNLAQWDSANVLEDSGIATSAVARKTGTPSANKATSWSDANTLQDAGFTHYYASMSVSSGGTTNLDINVGASSVFVAEIVVGGYGNAGTGNVAGLFVAVGNSLASSIVTVHTVLNSVTNGTMTLAWQANGTLRLSVSSTGGDGKSVNVLVKLARV